MGRCLSSRINFSIKRTYASRPVLVPTDSTVWVKLNRPAGAWRGGLVGFLLGLSITGLFCSKYVIQEYQRASKLLVSSIEELENCAQKLGNTVRRVDQIEQEVKQLKGAVGSKEDFSRLSLEMKQTYEDNSVDLLEQKAHLLCLTKDVRNLAQRMLPLIDQPK